MEIDHELCHKLRQTNVSTEYVRVLASSHAESVVHQKYREAADPPRLSAPAQNHGDFGEALRRGDLWDAFCRADAGHATIMLDVFDPIEIVICQPDSDYAWRLVAERAAAFGAEDQIPDSVLEEHTDE